MWSKYRRKPDWVQGKQLIFSPPVDLRLVIWITSNCGNGVDLKVWHVLQHLGFGFVEQLHWFGLGWRAVPRCTRAFITVRYFVPVSFYLSTYFSFYLPFLCRDSLAGFTRQHKRSRVLTRWCLRGRRPLKPINKTFPTYSSRDKTLLGFQSHIQHSHQLLVA